MRKEDIEKLDAFRNTVMRVCAILTEKGEQQLSNELALQSGFAAGLYSKTSDEIRKARNKKKSNAKKTN